MASEATEKDKPKETTPHGVWETRYGGKLDCLLPPLRRIITDYVYVIPMFLPTTATYYDVDTEYVTKPCNVLNAKNVRGLRADFLLSSTDEWALEIEWMEEAEPHRTWSIAYVGGADVETERYLFAYNLCGDSIELLMGYTEKISDSTAGITSKFIGREQCEHILIRIEHGKFTDTVWINKESQTLTRICEAHPRDHLRLYIPQKCRATLVPFFVEHNS
jgi:hypothetical protein